MSQWLNKLWYQPPPWWLPLFAPLSGLFRLIVALRRSCYRRGFFSHYRLPVPVIVVGNITVGGTGKTPLVIALAEHFSKQGKQVGIISRGYGGHAKKIQQVDATSKAEQVGDEALLLAQRTGCPMFIGRNRAQVGQQLLAKFPDTDLIICDDGLQHYRLRRDVEIVLTDSQRKFGNGYCLPLGPLREPLTRLAEVDLHVSNGEGNPDSYNMQLKPGKITSLVDSQAVINSEALAGQPLLAVCAIGNPERFFTTLTNLGLSFSTRVFTDHHLYRPENIAASPEVKVIMTEKDAVKCSSLATQQHFYLPVTAELSDDFFQALDKKLN